MWLKGVTGVGVGVGVGVTGVGVTGVIYGPPRIARKI